MRKALVAAASAAATTGGMALGAGLDWRAAAGFALGGAIVAAGAVYGIRNKLGAAELQRELDQAVREGRP